MSLIFFSFLLLVFIVWTCIAYLILIKQFNNRIVNKRLKLIQNEVENEYHPLISKLERNARKIFSRLIVFSKPNERWENSEIRMRFMRAGYQTELAALIFFSCKTVCTFIFPILCLCYFLIFSPSSTVSIILLVLVLSSGIGYYAPDVWLTYKYKARQRQILDSFPNALDLMRVCVSAGLGLDSAIERVGRELKIESSALAEEFHMLSLELRTGATRENALRNLAERTGVEDIKSLVSMLIQTEHFGTSVAEALRVHAEGLRSQRNLRAQEAAAKIPVKLTIPMILCIFPSLLVVILGPAMITLSRSILPIANSYLGK